MEERRLAAIMFTDIAGYTALMGKDEDQAFDLLKRNHTLHETLIIKYNGSLIKEIGDGTLASFTLASDAVRCAIEIQKACKDQNIPLKIGIHEGEMVFVGSDVLGDAVNIASRLQDSTEKGCITISGSVYNDIKNKTGIRTEFIGEQSFKNVDEPVRVYRVKYEQDQEQYIEKKKPGIRQSRRTIYFIGSFLLLIVIITLIWKFVPINDYITVYNKTDREEMDRSIAVLPFANLSDDPDQVYFSDGMMEEILMHLYKIGDLRVTSRTSVMEYKGTTKKIKDIAEELGVAHILEGSVRKSGDRVRITVQLIDPFTDNPVWAENYERELADIFNIQSEVAQKIASALKATIVPEVKESIEKIPTLNLEAYDFYLKGNEAFWASEEYQNLKKIHESIELYRKAIELDSHFSLAYTGLGRSIWWLGEWESDTLLSGHYKNAKTYLNKAIQLDSNNGWAYAELAILLGDYDWDSIATRKHLDKAISLMPNDVNAYRYYFYFESLLDNCTKARLIKNAWTRLDSSISFPYSIPNLTLLNCEGNSYQIIPILNKYWTDFNPNNAPVIFDIINYAISIDSIDFAKRIFNLRKNSTEDVTEILFYKAILAASDGNKKLSHELIGSLDSASQQIFVPKTWYAAIYAALNEKDQMYRLLETALNNRERNIHFIDNLPFSQYEDESRFKEIKRKMWTPLNPAR